MVSIICAQNFNFFQQPISIMNNPIVLEHPLRLKRKQLRENQRKNQLLLGFSECFGVVSMCKRWESEGDSELELKVLEFMKNSKNPEMFPSKNDLVDAGRVDLVEAIVKRGGWMSMGWNDDDNEVKIENGLVKSFDFGGEKCGEIDNDEGEMREVSMELDESHVSLELEREDVSGIEGILHRLERQRNISFGINLGKNVNMAHGFDKQSGGSSKDEEGSVGRNGLGVNGSVRSHSNTSSSFLKADTWRAWSDQRAGYSDKEFEAAEIDYGGNPVKKTSDHLVGEIIAVTTDINGGLDLTKDLDSRVREISQTDIKSRLQHLKSELSSALGSLNSNATDLSKKVEEHSSEDLRRLSDASEFQETEFMHTQHKLRSMRANLAVLEGKMALAMTDAQKILEEKQKRIDDAHVALQLLRTTCIVWPNSGSEVLLAGSFDGWATQWKMERSSTGIFTLWLKLYPGQYEIKFIVDGTWMVDPLRPIVNNNGFDNNLLIIS
ncbi:hypothetical protein RND81_07G187200 [Saponaria officinalis]|uniref:AMP-activated protein kinase glycogen-binding domain-containing protein n=1 Tax=Saponaria officinalis TaxID=3572 RepID=A0AAW1JRR1_SAPOF